MPQATWNSVVLAESENTLVVEGNHYFPPDAVKRDLLKPTGHTTYCGWKGTANYFSAVVGDQVNENCAWTYADPKAEAAHLKDHVAFWKGVQVVS